jgi:hypothetical protein
LESRNQGFTYINSCKLAQIYIPEIINRRSHHINLRNLLIYLPFTFKTSTCVGVCWGPFWIRHLFGLFGVLFGLPLACHVPVSSEAQGELISS